MPFEYKRRGGPPVGPVGGRGSGAGPVGTTVDASSVTPQAPLETDTFLDRMGGPRGLAATGVRVGTGFAAGFPAAAPGIGTAIGAGIAGGGESLAEWLEGSDQDLGRIGVEAGLGAVPLGMVFKAGRPVASAIRGGLQAGIGTAGRQYAASGEVDPRSVAESAVVGGGVGGALGKLFKGLDAPAPLVAAPYELETTAQRGGQVLGPKGAQPFRAPTTVTYSTPPPAPLNPAAPPRFSTREEYEAFKASQMPAQAPYPRAPVAYGIPEASVDLKELQHAAKAERDAAAMLQKEREAQDAAIAIDKAKQNLNQQDPTVSQTVSAPIPGGTERLTTKWAAEDVPVPSGQSSGMFDELGRALGGGPPRKGAAGTHRVLADTPAQAPPTASVLGASEAAVDPIELYHAWRASGVSHIQAWDNALNGLNPAQASAEASQLRELETFLGQIKGRQAELAPAPAAASVAQPVAPVTARPSATQRFDNRVQKILGAVDEPVQDVAPPVAQPATTPANISREDIHFGAPRGAFVEGVSPVQPEVAQFFPSRTAAAGSQYGNLKRLLETGEAPNIPPEARLPSFAKDASGVRMAGAAAARESKAAQTAVVPPPQAAQPVVPPSAAIPTEEISILQQLSTSTDPTEQIQLLDRLKQIQNTSPPAGGTTLGAGLGGAQGIFDIIQRNPQFAARLGAGAVGAGVGAASNEEDPFYGALIGGGIGAGGTAALQALQRGGGAARAAGERDGVGDWLMENIPRIQRFNHLADPRSIVINSFGAPYGALMTGGLEAGLSGDPRGYQLLKQSWNPVQFGREMFESAPEARRLIREGEMNRADYPGIGDAPGKYQSLMASPALAMTSGDVAARNAALRAGFSPAESRHMTMTNEAEFSALRHLSNLGRKTEGDPSNVFDMAINFEFPFRRTPINVGEQGSMRIPGVGSIVQSQRPGGADPWRAQVVQQGLGLGAMAGGYAAGSNLDPETAKWIRRIGSNMSGRYSLPFGMGFAAGQGRQRHQSLPRQIGSAFTQGIDDAMPLPATDTVRDWSNFVTGGGDGRPPRGSMPSGIRDELFPAEQSTALPQLKTTPLAWRRKP